MGDTRFIFDCIQTHLEELTGEDGFTQREMAHSISQKIGEYQEIMDRSSTVSAILDPRIKLSAFSNEKEQSAREHIKAIFETYQENSNTSSPTRRTSMSNVNTTRQYFTQLRHGANLQTSSEISSSASELDRYLESQIEGEVNPLLWWKSHTVEYPIVSDMAKDYLAIQATSVPSEQAFSVAGNTVTRTRNRLLPETTRACLCMKSWIVNKIGE
jgi:hypothetical protein